MPIAPPLFTPNNLNGGILAIGAGRLMHPMTMTCLPPPPPSGLLCPLPRPPLMMPPLPMQGILPGMLSPGNILKQHFTLILLKDTTKRGILIPIKQLKRKKHR